MVDRPSIQWVVEEAVAAGIDDIVIITSPHKKAVEDHFDRMAELEAALESKGKREMLGVVRHITDLATFHFTRQGAPLGLGHAVGTAARHVRHEPFGAAPRRVTPDGGQTLSRMIEVAEATGESVISLVPVEGPEISNYGCAGFSERQGDVITVDRLVEKPAFEDAPSNLRITGRYVLTPDIFETRAHGAGEGGEIQLTDAMAMQIDDRGMRGLVVDDVVSTPGRKPTGSGPMLSFRCEVTMALTSPPCCVLLWSRTASSLTG